MKKQTKTTDCFTFMPFLSRVESYVSIQDLELAPIDFNN